MTSAADSSEPVPGYGEASAAAGEVALVHLPEARLPDGRADAAEDPLRGPSADAADGSIGEDAPDAGAAVMGMGDHLAELRLRLLVCAAAFLPVFVAGMAAYSWLWETALLPARRAAAMLSKPLDALLVLRPEGPADPIMTIARWDLTLTLILLAPLWIYQGWRFLAPGLRRGERRALQWILGSGSALFVAGAALAYWWAVPLALAFLMPFNASLAEVENQWSINAYLSFLQMSCLGFGAAFETPLAMWALARAGLLKTAHLSRYWRHTVLAVVILSAILTPPDPFTQLLLSAVMLALIGVGWKLAELGEQAARRAAEE